MGIKKLIMFTFKGGYEHQKIIIDPKNRTFYSKTYRAEELGFLIDINEQGFVFSKNDQTWMDTYKIDFEKVEF